MEPEDKLVRSSPGPTHRPSPPALPGVYAGAPRSEEVPLRDYLRVIHKYRLTVLLFVLVAVLTVAVVSLRLPEQFEAVTRLAIDKESPNTLLRDNGPPQDPWSFQDYLRTQMRVLESETLAARTIRSLRLDREPEFAGRSAESKQEPPGSLAPEEPLDPATESRLIGAFLGRLQVAVVPDSWMVEIRFRSTDPELAARVANAHADNFIEHNFRTRYESTMRASEWLTDQLRELRAKVERAEEELVAFERRHNLVSINEKQNVLTQRLADLNHELSLVESDRVGRESELHQAEAGDLSVLRDPLVEKLQARLAELRTQHAEARPQFGPQHPRMQRLEEQIAEVEAQLADQRRAILAKLRADYQAARKREELLRGLVERQKQQVNQLNQHLIQYNILKREAATNKQLYEGLLQQLEEAGISAGLRSSNIRVVDAARVPTAPRSPKVLLNVLLAFFLSIPVGIALAFLREYLDNTVKTPDEVERYAALPILATVPLAGSLDESQPVSRLSSLEESEDSRLALATYRQPQSGMAEAFRSLRTSILLSFPERPPRVLLVTSGQPVDGKTAVSANLAVALAQRGDRVLLIDADLRKPATHKVFQTDDHGGLSLYLSGSRPRNGLILPMAIPQMFLLPAGPVPPNPAELLSSARMKELLGELAREFDHVILDSPPALSVTDATVLSAMVDGVILVVRSGQSTREVLRRTRQLFVSVNARVLGVVVNGLDLRSVDYSYYYYKYYGYGYRPDRAR